MRADGDQLRQQTTMFGDDVLRINGYVSQVLTNLNGNLERMTKDDCESH